MKRLWLDLGGFGGLLDNLGRGIDGYWNDHGGCLLRTILHAEGIMTDQASTRLCREWAEVGRQMVGYNMLLMNVRSYNFLQAKNAARMFKNINPDGVVLVGGMHASVSPEDMADVEHFDHICKGPGENSIIDLVQNYKDYPKLFDGEPSKRMEDWPRMDRTLWPKAREASTQVDTWPLEASCGWGPPPVATMITSRVCPWRCSLAGETRIPIEGVGLLRIDHISTLAGEPRRAVGYDGVILRDIDLPVASDRGMAQSVKWISEGPANTVRVLLQNGLDVVATPNHRFRVVRGGRYEWEKAGDLKRGDWVPVQHSTNAWGPPQKFHVRYAPKRNASHVGPTQHLIGVLDDELAWLSGLFVGDGSFSTNNRGVSWAVLPPLVRRVVAAIEKYFDYKPRVRTPSNCDKIRIITMSGTRNARFFSHWLGLGDNKLTVPERIFQGPASVAQSFVDGLFEADGYAPPKKGSPYIVTISEELAKGVALLQLNLGKCPAVRKVKNAPKSLTEREHHYRVVLHQPWDRVPVGRSAYTTYRTLKDGTRRRYQGMRKGLRTDAAAPTGVRWQTLEAREPENDLLQRDQWFTQVASVEPVGIRAVYDLTVPDGESFVGNGLVSHNSFCSEASYIPSMDRRSVDGLIDELNWLDETYGPLGSWVAHDSMFFQQPHWLKEFIEKYPKKANQVWPYWAAARADTVRKWPDLFEALVRETNWTTVSIGFESGSDRVLEILNKECTAEDNAFTIDLLNKIGDDLEHEGRIRPRFWANVMWGIPGETREDAFRTMKMFQRMKHPIPTFAYYAPFAGSVLGNQLLAEGKSLMEKDDHQRYAGQPKVKGVDYGFYQQLLAGRFQREVEATEWP